MQAFQYTKAQMDYFKGAFDFWYDRSMATTAKTIEMVTEATKLSFDYKIIWLGSPDTFELSIDGQITKIVYVLDLLKESGVEPKHTPEGFPIWDMPIEGKLTWELPEGKKNVVLYLPSDATVLLKNCEINAPAERPKKNAKVLWLGDSITQGFGPLRSAMTYVSVANRLLNYDNIHEILEQDPKFQEKIAALEDGVYIFGHSHVQWKFQAKDRNVVLINPGSCGLPLDAIRDSIPYSIMTVLDDATVEVEEIRVPFDKAAYVEELKKTTQFTEARVWTEVIIRELLTAREHLTFFLQFVNEYAKSIGDARRPFSVETWEQAYEAWKQGGDHVLRT